MNASLYEDLCYVVTAEVAVPARFAFDYLADIGKLPEWAVGLVRPQPVDGKTMTGEALFDGSKFAVRLDVDSTRLMVDYLIGPKVEAAVMRNSARVVPGENFDRGDQVCLVTLAAWRSAKAENRRWQRASALHDVEIHLIRERLETAWKARK